MSTLYFLKSNPKNLKLVQQKMNAQIELTRVWLVGVLALYKNSEVPAEIAQLSSRVLHLSPEGKHCFPPPPVPCHNHTIQIPKWYTLVSGLPLQPTIPWRNSRISTVYLLTVLPWCLAAHCWRRIYAFLLGTTEQGGLLPPQMRCQDELCSMYCGACSSACMILPSRSMQLFPTSWEKKEEKQLLPPPLHIACQSHKQVGLWDSSALLPTTEKQAGPWNFMENHWRKGKMTQSNHCP